jgi:hypothetical protein
MSRDAAIKVLSRQLGQTPPPGIRALSDRELLDLAGAIEHARHRQAAALQEAGERALGRIPRLLRGPVKKIAGG